MKSNNGTVVAWIVVMVLLIYVIATGCPRKPGDKVDTPSNVQPIPTPDDR